MSVNKLYYNLGVRVGAEEAPDDTPAPGTRRGDWVFDGKVWRRTGVDNPGGTKTLRELAMNAAAKRAADDNRPMVITFGTGNRGLKDDSGNRMGVVESFPKLDDAHVRYGQLADTPDAFDYVGLFNPKKETTFDPPAWPEPDLEFGHSVASLPVPVHVRNRSTAGGWVAAGIAALLGLFAISGKKRRG